MTKKKKGQFTEFFDHYKKWTTDDFVGLKWF